MQGLDFARMAKPGGADQFGKRMERVAMEIVNAGRLVFGHQRPLAPWILCGHAGRTTAGMTRQRLDAAEREHETARCVAPVGAERHSAGDIESRDDLATGAEPNLLAQI